MNNSNSKYREIIRFITKHLRLFSSDDLTLLACYAGCEPRQNDISSAIQWAKGKKLIKKTDKACLSALYGKNSISRAVWKSLKTKEAQ